MTTLGARLALWYCLVTTITMFGLLAGGYLLLNRHLVSGVDMQLAAEFQRLSAERLPATEFAHRASPLFLIEALDRSGAVLARSADWPELPTANHTAQFTARAEGQDFRVQTWDLDGQRIRLATSLTPVRDLMLGYAEISLILVCMVLLFSLISGMLLSRVALHPVRLIQETANRIRSDNLSERIPVGKVDDEIASLARLLNEMFDRLEEAFQQIRRFSAEASHELKTPLSLMRLQGERLLAEGRLDATQEEAVEIQLEEITRMNQIIDELLFLSRAEARAISPHLQALNPADFLAGFTPDAALLAEQAEVRMETRIDPKGEAVFDPKWMRQVLLNLLSNALKVSPRGALLTLESTFTVDHWVLALEDEGPGVPPEQRERMFERFVRLDNSEGGTGLGLAICRSILAMHGGVIRAEEGPRKQGLRVICEIPLRPEEAGTPPQKESHEPEVVD